MNGEISCIWHIQCFCYQYKFPKLGKTALLIQMEIRYVPEIYTLISNSCIFKTSKLVILKLDTLCSFLWIITACMWCVSWAYYNVFHRECCPEHQIYGFNIQTVTDWIPTAITNTRSRVSVAWKYAYRQLISYLVQQIYFK